MSELTRIIVTLFFLSILTYVLRLIFNVIDLSPLEYTIYLVVIVAIGLFYIFLPKKIGLMFLK